ncbi:hypothetical protein TNCV_1685631 [Trichonephila clavipes]|nr:hypothetical protein TNCV_1685631 [Trichonephila clavipes]
MSVQDFCSVQHMQLLPSHAYSWDMSPMEHVWDLVGRRFARDSRPRLDKSGDPGDQETDSPRPIYLAPNAEFKKVRTLLKHYVRPGIRRSGTCTWFIRNAAMPLPFAWQYM